MTQEDMKKKAAEAALSYIEEDAVVGVGTGSTVNYFIDVLAQLKHKIEGAVASSDSTAERLRQKGIRVFDLNGVANLSVYVDGADEVNSHFQLIKGGGGALTREKVVASVAKTFVCIVDESKWVDLLGKHPLAIEVLPIARSYVAREVLKMGGQPVYREGFLTDNGNIILDVYHLDMLEPMKLEKKLNNIVGVVCHGLFANRTADVVLLSTSSGIKTIKKEKGNV